jgi:type III secretory pathway component EscU
MPRRLTASCAACYAVLTIGDWWFDRKQLEHRLKVG